MLRMRCILFPVQSSLVFNPEAVTTISALRYAAQ